MALLGGIVGLVFVIVGVVAIVLRDNTGHADRIAFSKKWRLPIMDDVEYYQRQQVIVGLGFAGIGLVLVVRALLSFT